jgi:hypothetical protein
VAAATSPKGKEKLAVTTAEVEVEYELRISSMASRGATGTRLTEFEATMVGGPE